MCSAGCAQFFLGKTLKGSLKGKLPPLVSFLSGQIISCEGQETRDQTRHTRIKTRGANLHVPLSDIVHNAFELHVLTRPQLSLMRNMLDVKDD